MIEQNAKEKEFQDFIFSLLKKKIDREIVSSLLQDISFDKIVEELLDQLKNEGAND